MNRLRPWIVCLTIVFLFAFALWLRVSPPFNSIFTDAGIRFSTVDAYYHMHVVDNIVHNFPKPSEFLPYLDFPGGQESPAIYLFDWLLAAIIWIVGLGAPTAQTIDVVGVYYPAVLGALTIIPVYFMGKALFGRWAGIIAAALIATMPGEFMGRSILGSTDQHVAETLFTTTTMLFLILAIKAAKQSKLSFSQFKDRDWAVIVKPMTFSLLAGLFLGIYLLTWYGALLFFFIIFVFFVIQFFADHIRHESSDYLSLVGLGLFAIATIMFLPAVHDRLNLSAMVIALLAPPALNLISRLMAKRQINPAYFPLSVIGLGVVVTVILRLAAPTLFQAMLASFSIFYPTGASLTTLEMQRILTPTGSFTLALVWGNFTASFFLSLVCLMLLNIVPRSPKSWIGFAVILTAWISLSVIGQQSQQAVSILITILSNIALLICLIIRQKEADKSLLVVWGLVMLAATIGQRRFAYYFAVNAAVLSGYFSAWVMDKCGLMKSTTRNENSLFTVTVGVITILFLLPSFKLGFLNPFTWIGIPAMIAFFVALFFGQEKQTGKEIRARRRITPVNPRFSFNAPVVNLVLALLMVFLTIFFPNFVAARQTASGASFAPSDAWMESLTWMRANTPEPFGNPDYYYVPPSSNEYPASVYGVLSWWDYGYWITRIARRIPNVNPSQDAVMQRNVATIFTSQNETQANEIVRQLGSAYVIIDDQTALGKFWAVATWAGKSPTEFYDTYYVPQGGNQLAPVQFPSPQYYRSLIVRLYNFDGKAVNPEETETTVPCYYVISYDNAQTTNGPVVKVITSDKSFMSYREAEAYRVAQNSTKYTIVSVNPFASSVPLDAVQDYKLIYSSSQVRDSGAGLVSEIKIFEFTAKTSQSAGQ